MESEEGITKRIIPSDFLQVIECDEISTIVNGNGKLPLTMSTKKKEGQSQDYWEGSWLIEFCGSGKGAGKLWRPEVSATLGRIPSISLHCRRCCIATTNKPF